MSGAFLQLVRSKETEELMKDPNSFMLLTQIAYRARRTDEFNVIDLEPGEALIGDYRNIGLSERKYRTAKNKLEKWKFATFKPTSKGTIAKLINSRVFDINIVTNDDQKDRQETNERRASDGQTTTNNNDNNEKNNISHLSFVEFWRLYPRKVDEGSAQKEYGNALSAGVEHSTIMAGLNRYIEYIENSEKEERFIKYPAKWLNKKCWNDVYEQSKPKKNEGLF